MPVSITDWFLETCEIPKPPLSFIEVFLRQLKHSLALDTCKIKHSASSCNFNKALGFTSCFVSISAMY